MSTGHAKTKVLGPRRDHFWKLQNMLRVTGTDAVGAFSQGQLSPEDWAGMVETCRGCNWVTQCSRYMARERLEGRVREAPSDCPNERILTNLRRTYPEVA